ncbi:hypothetical protein PAPYR_4477 [Paratrimastix pyriformis]|uniref:TRAF-type domain-containing protein n=1 Tax=Paratrimastix pyriformis TaxID=342808 RepID=A0ABQ8UJP3_9EUKA|nr:hypothetical protein PAPYR_4477 [Paratrimastix pyriformis]
MSSPSEEATMRPGAVQLVSPNEDPVSLSCGDTVCRACAAIIGDVKQLHPLHVVQRLVRQIQCHCPNRGLGCESVVGVLDVERHLQAECEWREEECDQCHQQVRRAEMAHHKDTTCAAKPVACGYADVGCPTSCAQCDLAVHERDGAQLAESRAAQSDTTAALNQTQHDLAQTKAQLAQTQQEPAAVRSQIDQLLIPPAAPEGLEARWDEAKKEVVLDWRPVPGIVLAAPDPAAACCALAAAAAASPPAAGLPIRSRVQATIIAEGAGCDLGSTVVYTGPECRCRYRFPPGAALDAGARFAVAMRGLAESVPSLPVTCTRPAVVFSYDHDMDKRGLFYDISTRGRTQPWQNPAEAGWVTVTRSSDLRGKASDLTGHQPCHSFTNYQPTPSCDLEHRLQSWRLEGSVHGGGDGSWRTLDEHTNEPNAIPARPDAMATFAVAPERAFPARRFRVLMTGPSPNNGYHYLMLSGLEMYGSLLPDPAQHPP